MASRDRPAVVPAPSFVGRIEDEISGLSDLLNVGKLQTVLVDILNRLGAHAKILASLQETCAAKAPADEFEMMKSLLRELDLLSHGNERRIGALERDIASRPTGEAFQQHAEAIRRIEAELAERPSKEQSAAMAAAMQRAAADIARLQKELDDLKKGKADKVVVDDLIQAQHKANEELSHLQKSLADKASRAEHLNITAKMEALTGRFEDLARQLVGEVRRAEARAAAAEAGLGDLAKQIEGRASRGELDQHAENLAKLNWMLAGLQEAGLQSAAPTPALQRKTSHEKLPGRNPDRAYGQVVEDVKRLLAFAEAAERRLGALDSGHEQLRARKAEAAEAAATAKVVAQHEEDLTALRPLLALRPSLPEVAATVPEHGRAIEELARTKASLADLAEKLGRGDQERLREEARRAYEEAYGRLRDELAARFRRLELDGEEMGRLHEAIERLLGRLQEKADRDEILRLKRMMAPLFDANGNFSAAAYKCIACDSATPVLGVKGLMRVAADAPGLPPKAPSSSAFPSPAPVSARPVGSARSPSPAGFPPRRPASAPKARAYPS